MPEGDPCVPCTGDGGNQNLLAVLWDRLLGGWELFIGRF